MAVFISFLSCSSKLTETFAIQVDKISNYFAQHPILLGSNKIIKDNQIIFAYYALKIENYELFSDIQRNIFYPASGYIKVSCEASSNQNSGDLIDERIDLIKSVTLLSPQGSGFSTTAQALQNSNFTAKTNVIFLLNYTYRKGEWVFTSVRSMGDDASMISYLTELQRYDDFRKAIGMTN